MTRRLLAILIALVGTAAVVVVGLVTFFPMEDRTTLTSPEPVRAVEVDVEHGRVDVVATDGDLARVTVTRQWLLGEPGVRDVLEGGVLRLEAECPTFVTAGCSVDYRVEAPAGVAVRVTTDRGSVSVAGVTGMVEVDSGAGNVRLDRTRGPARVETSAGNVDGVEIVAEYLDATTDAGRIRLSLAEPPGRLGLKTGAGNIDVALPAAPGGYRVTTDTGAGQVDVGVEQNPGGNRAVSATTGAGNIRVRTR